ncbi:MAG: tetrahydrofolate dehydrogenase/cyclohydrolase catalytic domain-containing protein [Acidimicrobiales bacterium]|nr:tetrahydrofolate dehydrogenase/cyclohydrolase catalytic domain-containing protein [Acidimicrobiales bacterium]
MPAIKLDGELLASELREDLYDRIKVLERSGVRPGLGTILVGNDGPSQNYVAMKHRDCQELGMYSREATLTASASQQEVLNAVEDMNNDPEIHAFIIQYPFPNELNYESALLTVNPHKDADGLHPINLGRLVQGVEAPLACTPAGIQLLLERYEVPIEGQHVVIVGRGLTIGRPLANLLSLKNANANAAVTIVHTGIHDISAYTRQADILIAAAGSPRMITAEMVKPGAAVVAAGVSFDGKKLVSDVDDTVEEIAGWLSPRIGGVGPMTRALLMQNTVVAAERSVL